MHTYARDAQSGAGNCTCGWAECTKQHWHLFEPTRDDLGRCVCGAFYDGHAPYDLKGGE